MKYQKENYGRFKPGESGNPKGRPKKGYSITEWFRELFKSNPEIKDKIGNAILDKAIKGDIVAAKLIWTYMDGIPQYKKEDEVDRPEPRPILSFSRILSEEKSNED